MILRHAKRSFRCYLLNIYQRPEEAAAIWKANRVEDPDWSDGWVSLTYRGNELVAADLWDEVFTFWGLILTLLDDFYADGFAETEFPDQPVPIVLRQIDGDVYFRVHAKEVQVDLDAFSAGILYEAERFFLWCSQHLNDDVEGLLRQIFRLRSKTLEN